MQPHLLLIVLDTARADAFRPWGGPMPSPILERLCREGTWFETAVAAAPWTLPSTASILTGTLPSEHGIGGWAFELQGGTPTSPAAAVRSHDGVWLPEALRERGYATLGVSCNPWVSAWGGFDRGFDRLVDIAPGRPLPRSRLGWATRRVREPIDPRRHGGPKALAAFTELTGRAPSDRPLFAFVNLMEMHAPYDPPMRDHPLRYGGAPGVGQVASLYRQVRQTGFRKRADEAYLATIRALYLAAGRFTDRLTGAFIAGFLSRVHGPAVVVVLSDHGENLGDHGLFAHHSSLHESLLRVPLAVWGRGVQLAAGRTDGPRSLLGLGAWILSIADGASGPPDLDGPVVAEYESTRRHMGLPRELRHRRECDGADSLPRLVEHAGLAIRDGNLKYLASADGHESLHDLATDPTEIHDLLPADDDRVSGFRASRDEWLRRLDVRPRVSEPGPVAEREIAEHLRSLGYIE